MAWTCLGRGLFQKIHNHNRDKGGKGGIHPSALARSPR